MAGPSHGMVLARAVPPLPVHKQRLYGGAWDLGPVPSEGPDGDTAKLHSSWNPESSG